MWSICLTVRPNKCLLACDPQSRWGCQAVISMSGGTGATGVKWGMVVLPQCRDTWCGEWSGCHDLEPPPWLLLPAPPPPRPPLGSPSGLAEPRGSGGGAAGPLHPGVELLAVLGRGVVRAQPRPTGDSRGLGRGNLWRVGWQGRYRKRKKQKAGILLFKPC